MKQVYSFAILAWVFLTAFTQNAAAQCTCSGGLPATQVSYNATLPSSTNPSSTILFPQFNPAIGTLACVSFMDTITGISTTYVTNTAPSTVDYKFNLAINNDIEGPGVSVTPDFSGVFGPDSLKGAGLPGDSITYGPVTVFSNHTDSTVSSNVAAYLGGGTVGFTYTINGGLTTVKGGINYKDSISTIYSGQFGLSYFWCPSAPLASSITGFSATDKGKFVQLLWEAANNEGGVNYEIQYSKNGSQFFPIGEQPAGAGSGGSTSYQFQYNIDQNNNQGIIYFRIRLVDANGVSTYSTIKMVNLTAGLAVGIQSFPNPVTNSVTLTFDENQTGDFLFSVISITGQVIMQKEIVLSGTNLVNLDISNHPAKGMYFLRSEDLVHNKKYVNKLLIE
jgi:Secretion system C-terminal sorting domain